MAADNDRLMTDRGRVALGDPQDGSQRIGLSAINVVQQNHDVSLLEAGGGQGVGNFAPAAAVRVRTE